MNDLKIMINNKLKNIKLNIDNILSSSEEEFLALGETLSTFSNVLYSIEVECSIFSSGKMEEITETEINSLKILLTELNDFISSSNNSYNTALLGINSIDNNINKLKNDVKDFKEKHGILKYLNFSVKKESSKIDNEDSRVFNLLSTNIENLDLSLEKSLSEILSFIEKLSGNIRESNINTNKEKNTSKDTFFNTINNGIISMVDRNKLLKNKINSVSNRFIEINDYIGQVVVSLQKHDIIRQQFEHILKAFNYIDEKSDSLSDAEYFFLSEKIFQIQLAQINNSKNEIEEAQYAIETSIDGIHDKINNMSPILLGLNKYNEISDEENPILTIEKGISNVTKHVNNIQQVENKILETILDVNNKVRSLDDFIGEIEAISNDIKLISFNSQIASLHIGNMGKTLRVISDEIGSYTVIVEKNSTTISQNISKVIENSDKLSKQLSSDDNNANKKSKEIIKKSKHSINFFENINKTFFKSINHISENNNQLLSDINSMKKGLNLNEFTIVIDDIKNVINGIITDLPNISEDDNIREELLTDLLNSYTMNSERQTHEAVISGKISDDIFNDDSDDNIELF